MHSSRPRLDRLTWIMLAVALVLRVGVVLAFYAVSDLHGSDAAYYIKVAHDPARLWFPENTHDAVTTIGPGYPLFLLPFLNLPGDAASVTPLVGARLANALVDTLTVLFVYLIAWEVFGARVARVVLVAQALDPRHIFLVGAIATEMLFIALFTLFMLAYLLAVSQDGWGRYRAAGILLGLAVLTRPIPLLFPVLLAIHIWFHPKNRRRALGGFAWMVVAMLLLFAPWTVRTAMITGEFVPVADTAFSQFWMASQEKGRGLGGSTFYNTKIEEFGEGDRNPSITSDAYIESGVENVLAAPGAWIGRIARETLQAYAQPYGTILLVSRETEGVRAVLEDFLHGQAAIGDVLSLPGLGRRGLMYLWHYWGLLFGLAGAAMAWRQKRWQSFPLIAWIIYGTATMSVLLIEPRYLFPLMFAFTILAAYASVGIWDALRSRVSIPLARRARPA
jgi:4-amino-4-deoxy-L-arabinose transferase-like glycosyltransferase